MNIAQTRQLLSFMWSKFPNSARLTVEDKQMTVLAYFDELWQYSLQDALDACRMALHVQPHFVPSAPEIAHYAQKTYTPERFLSPEYERIQKQIEEIKQQIEDETSEYDSAFKARIALTNHRIFDLIPDDEKIEYERLTAIIEGYLDLKNGCRKLEQQKDILWQDAINTAEDAYVASENALAHQDFKQLGWVKQQALTE